MENPRKLIILLTWSPNDYEELLMKRNWCKEGQVCYLDCNDGISCAVAPFSNSPRLLGVVLRSKSKEANTKEVQRILGDCPGFKVVIGTHTQEKDPSDLLDLRGLPEVPVTRYSTAGDPYNFVYHWCQELAKDGPNVEKVKKEFDHFFELLQAGQTAGIRPHSVECLEMKEWSRAKHHLLNLLTPIRFDFEGWKDSGFDNEYFVPVPIHPFSVEEIRHTVYGNPGVASSASLKKIVEQCLKANLTASQQREVEASWARLQKLVPRSGQWLDRSLFAAATGAIQKLQTDSGRNELRNQTQQTDLVLQWIDSIKAELRLLSKVIEAQSQ